MCVLHKLHPMTSSLGYCLCALFFLILQNLPLQWASDGAEFLCSRVPNQIGVPEWPCPEGTPSRSLAAQLWRDSCTLHAEAAVQAKARNTRVSCGREFNTPLGSHSATGVGGQDAQAPGPLPSRRERCRRLPHLPRAPGVGDNALTGLLNIQTHLELTSQSQRQHHQPHRRRCPRVAPGKSLNPRHSGLGGAKAQDTLYCSENS